jgi:hypothetical protein
MKFDIRRGTAVTEKLKSLMRMGPARRRLLAEALLWLALSRLALLVLPFRRVAAHLGDLVPLDGEQLVSGSKEDARLAQEIGWAVRRMAAHVPFRAVCLQQAIAAKIMLRRRGIQSRLYFGVATGEPPVKKLQAHAWLLTADAKVTGYPVAEAFTKIACFL